MSVLSIYNKLFASGETLVPTERSKKKSKGFNLQKLVSRCTRTATLEDLQESLSEAEKRKFSVSFVDDLSVTEIDDVILSIDIEHVTEAQQESVQLAVTYALNNFIRSKWLELTGSFSSTESLEEKQQILEQIWFLQTELPKLSEAICKASTSFTREALVELSSKKAKSARHSLVNLKKDVSGALTVGLYLEKKLSDLQGRLAYKKTEIAEKYEYTRSKREAELLLATLQAQYSDKTVTDYPAGFTESADIKFTRLNSEYHYFSDSDKELFNQLSHVLSIYTSNFETQHGGDLYADYAYKLMILFKSKYQDKESIEEKLQAILSSFDKYSKSTTAKTLHDCILLIDIPKLGSNGISEDVWHAWSDKVCTSGSSAELYVESFISAQAICNKYREDGFADLVPDVRALSDINKNMLYDGVDGFESMARLFKHYNVDQAMFDAAKGFVRTHGGIRQLEQRANLLPDISTSSSDDRYHIVRLPKGDPRGLILGKITNCCQSINGHSRMCVEDGMLLDNNGFYIMFEVPRGKRSTFDPQNIDWANLERSATIIGQAYAWHGQDRSDLVFDSWEGNIDSSKQISLIQQFSRQLVELDEYHRVFVGNGGGTPNALRSTGGERRVQMLEGRNYGDSHFQSALALSSQLLSLRSASQTGKGFSYALLECYTTLTEEQKQKADDNQDVLLFLTNIKDQADYEQLVTELFNLYDSNNDKYNTLISDQVREAIFNDRLPYITFDSFRELDRNTIQSITRPNVIKVIEDGRLPYITFDSLKGLDADRISAITSDNAIKVMIDGIYTFDLLKTMDGAKIRAFTTPDVCQKIRLDFDLQELDGLYERDTSYNKTKFKDLTAKDTTKILQNGKITLSELEALYDKDNTSKQDSYLGKKYKIKFLSLCSLYNYAMDVGITFEELINLYETDLLENKNDLEALVSWNVKRFVEESGISFAELKALYDSDISENKEKFKALTSFRVGILLKSGIISFPDVESLYDNDISENKEKFKALTSFRVGILLKSGIISFPDVESLYDNDISENKKRFKALTSLGSPDAFLFAELETLYDRDLSEDKDKDKHKFTSLTTSASSKLINSSKVTLSELEALYDNDLSENKTKFDTIISHITFEFMQKDVFSLSELESFYDRDTSHRKIKFKSLINDNIARIIESSVSFSKLEALYDADQIEQPKPKLSFLESISQFFIGIVNYFKNKFKSEDDRLLEEFLSGFRATKFSELTSASAAFIIFNGASFAELETLYNMDVEKFRNLCSRRPTTTTDLLKAGVIFEEISILYDIDKLITQENIGQLKYEFKSLSEEIKKGKDSDISIKKEYFDLLLEKLNGLKDRLNIENFSILKVQLERLANGNCMKNSIVEVEQSSFVERLGLQGQASTSHVDRTTERTESLTEGRNS